MFRKSSSGNDDAYEPSATNGHHPDDPYEDALIYAAPTVDTLGDEESLLSRFYHSPRGQPETNGGGTTTTTTNTHKTTVLMQEDSLLELPSLSLASRSMGNSTKGNNNSSSNHGRRSIANHSGRRLLESPIDSKNNNNNSSFSRQQRRRKIRTQKSLIEQQQQQEEERRKNQQRQLQRLNRERRRRKAANVSKEFQLEEDQMSVVVRTIPIAERKAFDKKLPPFLANAQNTRKISPSWQHWKVLQQLSNVTHVRQLAFSKSVGSAVDVFWNEEEEHRDEEKQLGGGVKRDGRYRSIDPVQATMEALPKTPPLLSNKKHRLPMRTDVGFANASMEEITQKQMEIRRETEWEEASPRLVVLVTGDDLGTAEQDDDTSSTHDESSAGASALDHDTRRRGLPGMPYAGKDLIRAKERNNRHFSRHTQHKVRDKNVVVSVRNDRSERATNMLAPPLDAIYSGTVGWRSRPFHDRPPGLRYTLVCPMAVRFSVGNMEPLVCSLALYSLKTGKISEEFYFPAGDWDGKLRLDALEERRNTNDNVINSEEDEETELLTQLWSQRKHKAIFAHNTWAMGDDEDKENNNNSLYIVLQVYKVTHVDSVAAYWSKGGNNANYLYGKDKKTWKKKLKRRFQKDGRKSTGENNPDDTEIEKALLRSNAIFDAYGTQFTSPLCFGITHLFPEDTDATSRSNTWPRGQVQQNMDLYAAPTHSESQEDFLKRLRKVVASSTAAAPRHDGFGLQAHSVSSSNLSAVSEEVMKSFSGGGGEDDQQSTVSVSRSADSPRVEFLSPSKKKASVRNRFKRMGSKKDLSSTTTPDSKIEDTPLIPGSVTLFTSNLGVDFLQSMLTTPPELIDKISTRRPTTSDNGSGEEVILPRILVDASGDSAIMVDPKETAATSSRRSDLVRLPSTRLAEHLDSSEFREVLFLSPESDRIFESSDHRSLLNLLYLYPRLLVLKSKDAVNTKQKEQHPHRYTVRVRLVQSVSATNEAGVMESRNEIVTSFHNPASWGGSNLLQSVFTRIPRDKTDSVSISSRRRQHQPADDPQVGIPLRDEFKMKLPTILDGSYFLQFSLFAVDVIDYMEDQSSANGNIDSYSSGSSGDDELCGITLSPLAETTIPLSSSSTRDPKSGVKATTVIPNGCHRLKLGNFQLQVETRLVSSIHVSDPAVAAALREFPLASNDAQPGKFQGMMEALEEMAISSRHSIVGKSMSSSRVSESLPTKIPYPTLIASASGSGLASHFHPLFFLHLRNLTKTTSGQDIETSDKFIIDNMQSLLVLFQKVKSFFLSPGRDRDKTRLNMFLKATVDLFDESSYNKSVQGHQVEDDTASEYIVEETNSMDLDVVEEEVEEHFDGGAIRRRTKEPIRSDIVIRLTRTYSTLEATEVSFSRVAYGASKSDHMRLEAELGSPLGHTTQLFDDDETVVTLKSTRKNESQIIDARHKVPPTSQHGEALNEKKSTSSNSLLHQTDKPTDSDDTNTVADQNPLSELNIGKRMKSAAQVMLAPCANVTPTLAAFLCRTSPQNAASTLEAIETKNDFNILSKALEADLEPIAEDDTLHQISSPGSDLDDDEASSEKRDPVSSQYCNKDGIFRGTRKLLELQFSIPQGYSNGRKPPLSRGSYVYESIMALWLQAWSDYVSNLPQNSKNGISINFLGKEEVGNGFSMFYLHMDLLFPMMLKSIVLRCSQTRKISARKEPRCVLDKEHVYVFESFVEMLAVGLMGQAMAELQEPIEHGTLIDALNACDHIVDFITGLFAVVHPAHMEGIISKLMMTIRKCEGDSDGYPGKASIEWNEAIVHRTKCSRQLRLRIVEKLAVLPNFVALNFPERFSSKHVSSQTRKSVWTMQHNRGSSDSGDNSKRSNAKPVDDGLLPRTGWLASLLTNESLSICALSCETVLMDAIATIETQEAKNDKTPIRSSLKKLPASTLKRSDLLMFQSIAIHAISSVYELLLRRHAMDRRFQTESTRGRIAALFTHSIFEKSLASVRWLARVNPTHKVRSIWLLCFVYILQEAPENLVRECIRSYSDPSDFKVHQFIRLLRLGSATFQSFVDQQRHCMFPMEIDKEISPWLLQESFNTVCATTIILVEECAAPTSSIPNEQRKMIREILDLLLHVLTTPQSTVTHLRAMGGAIQAFEKFGTQMFLETTGSQLQHWIRVTIGLMNSVSLSVRSIAVDFVISLFCGVFDLQGNIDDVALIFATVLPEVVAREIALCSVNGLINSLEDAEKSIWPLRRSFADIEDANPLDDDRVDPQLSPVLSIFCRSSQAIIDGVIVEMRLRGDDCVVVGTRISSNNKNAYTFDADEESLYEAANFFSPETSPMQRLRWLLTLKSLHEAKGHWVEAAETLIMSARTISDAIPHLNHVWRPERFSLWSDTRRSLWLTTVGEEIGNPERGNAQVMTFANSFLEPETLLAPDRGSDKLLLPRPTLKHMSPLLTAIAKEAVNMYNREGGMDVLAYTRLESLLKIVMGVLDDHEIKGFQTAGIGLDAILKRKQYVEEVTYLRKVIASITGDMTKIAEKLLLTANDVSHTPKLNNSQSENTPKLDEDQPYYVRLLLSGRKPRRFEESTTLPTFIEWENPCICRVPKDVIQDALSHKSDVFEVAVCNAFGKSIRDALLQDLDAEAIAFGTGNPTPEDTSNDMTYINIDVVRGLQDGFASNCRRFLHRIPSDPEDVAATTFVQMTVAISFPCPLSRQRSMLTNEFVSSR